MSASEPRAHHYVPQFWLAGFTGSGEKNGKLWVTDLERKKQWPTTPANAGHRRDYYRIEGTDIDPFVVEKAFASIENSLAPLLSVLVAEQRGPQTDDEMASLAQFMALQFARVPAFRPLVLSITDAAHKAILMKALESRESWDELLKKLDISEHQSTYEEMKAFEESGDFTLSAATEWYMARAFEAARHITPILMQRYWRVLISTSGSFIGSDNPVMLDGPRNEPVGFTNAEVVVFPLSRHMLALGTMASVGPPHITRLRIAATNTLSMLHAESQVFSHVADFCWLDAEEKFRTDNLEFSAKSFLGYVPKRGRIGLTPRGGDG